MKSTKAKKGRGFVASVQQKSGPLIGRLSSNLKRVEKLIETHKKLHGAGIKKSPSDGDILRAAVVLLHASLEDFLRGISITYVPISEAALNKIPLLGLMGREERFHLGALLKHRNKSVRRLIDLSVEAYLQQTTYSNIPAIKSLLSDCGISSWDDMVKDTYPAIARLMLRRHQIVHRADSRNKYQKEDQKTEPISLEDVNEWLSAVNRFRDGILSIIVEAEHKSAFSKGYIHYLNSLIPAEFNEEIDNKIADSVDAVVSSDAASDAMASTNARGFGIDEYTVERVSFDMNEKECRVWITWHATGDLDPDKSITANELAGTAIALINDKGEVSHEETTAYQVESVSDF